MGDYRSRQNQMLVLLLTLLAFGLNLFAQNTVVPAQITAKISDAAIVRIPNSTHPLVKSAKDTGRASSNLPMQRMLLVLKPSDAQEKVLRKMIDAQHNPNSKQYHQWLTPEQFNAQFAPAAGDVQKISGWLSDHGFAVEKPARGGRWIEFSGTAAQVEKAFHTEMHTYEVKGESHIANAQDIAIPRAMAPVVAGVLSLHNFQKPAAHVKVTAVHQDAATRKLLAKSPATAKADPKKLDPNVTVSDGYGYAHFLAPGDMARIYNSLPLLNAGIDGSGVSIAIVGRTDIELSDVQSFRKLFSLSQNDPVFITNGPDPGFTGDEIESDLDVQWAGAIAPNATIKFVTSASTTSTDGVDLSAAYIVDNALAPIMSTSYGLCEAYLGPAGNAFQNALYQQAAAEGISAFVSSGDNGAAGCDNPQYGIPAQSGFMVSGLASTPYATAVGGTQFNENGASGTFWSANNNADYSSAVGYIPEAVWNESCDPTVDANQCGGYGYSLEAGSGGASNCSDVTWTTDSSGNIYYTCNAGYKKPNWQAGTGVPDDKVRDLPDVSMAAAGGHDGYIICSEYAWPFYDLTCQVDDSTKTILNAGVVGGTSAAAPSMAGALALVEHKNGQWAGLANYNFYKLAAADTLTDCNSSNLTDPNTPSKCVFHDVTVGSNAVPCAGGTADCNTSDPTLSGLLNGHSATAGFDLGTGLGSVDISNLADAWGTVTSLPTTTTMTAGAATVVHGQPLSLNVAVAPTTGTGKPSGDFALVTSTSGTVLGGTLADGAFHGNVSNLPGGTYSFTAHYGGDGMFAASDSAPVSITVTPEDSTLNLDAYFANFMNILVPLQGDVVYGAAVVIDARALAKSGNGNATGSVNILLDGATIATLPLGSNGDTALIQVDTLVSGGILPGSHTLSASYSGDASFNASTSKSYSFNVVKVSPPVLLSASAMTITKGNSISFDILVGSAGGKLASGTVQIYNADAGTPISGALALTSTADGAVAHFTATSLPVGNYTVKASYSGDANYNSVNYGDHYSSGPYITVNPVTGAADTVTLTATPASVTLGGSVNYVVTIKGAKSGGSVPTGTVMLLGQNGAVYGSGNPVPLTNGSATFVLPWYYGGSYSLYADYSGDANYSPQQSAATITKVNPGTPTISLTTVAAAVLPGAQTSFTATVVGQPSNPNLSYPFGAVQFYDSVNGGAAQPLGSPQYLSVATGYNPIVSFPVVLGAGSHAVTATYLGTADWASVTSNAVSVIVTPPDFSVSVDNPTLNIPAGATGTAKFTITDLLGFSSDVTLACGSGVPAGSACSVTPSTIPGGTSGTATLTLTTGAPSPQSSASLYRGLGFGIGTSTGLAGLLLMFLPRARRRKKYASLLMMVACFGFLVACGGDSKSNSPQATMVQLASSNTKAASGDSVTFTATIEGLSSTQSGAVTFYDGTTSIGQANVSGTSATLQVNNLSVGAHAISAKYAGDSSNKASSSATITQVITGSTQLQVTATAGSVVHTTTLTVNIQ